MPIVLNEQLKTEMAELLKKHKVVFGNHDDILIKEYSEKLKLKSLTNEQRNSLMSKIIYYIKKNV